MRINNSSQISVLVQGAVDLVYTPLCLQSIRSHFPCSEIILSTWEDSHLDGLDYDVLILSKDPGGFRDAFKPHFTNNLLRQLVSTQSGIQACTRPYILKTRSDIFFTSNRIAKTVELFPKRDQEWSVFDARIITCSYFSKKYLKMNPKIHPTPFHVSDWISFGLNSDIEKLYDVPLPIEPEQTTYFLNNPYKGIKHNLLCTSHRYAPEQYILYHAVKKCFPHLQFQHYMDFDRENIVLSEKIIAHNFTILPPRNLGLLCLKRATDSDTYYKWCRYPFSLPRKIWKGLYRLDVFVNDYRKYCDTTYHLPLPTQAAFFITRLIKEII